MGIVLVVLGVGVWPLWGQRPLPSRTTTRPVTPPVAEPVTPSVAEPVMPSGAQPAAPPVAEPVIPPGAPLVAQPVAEPEVVVVDIDDLQPPEEELYGQAAGFQAEEQPAQALTLLLDVLRYYPQGRRAEEALFRASECYRALGRQEDALKTLGLLKERFPKGIWRAAGGLLEGELWIGQEKWEQALEPLGAAVGSAEVGPRARYLRCLALERLGRLKDGREDLLWLAEKTKGPPYADYAAVKLGTQEGEAGQAARALDWFKKALSVTANEQLRAEAAVRSGNLAYAAGRHDDAVAYFEIVRRTESPPRWRELAHLGLVQAKFAAGDYAGALRVFQEVKPEFPEPMRGTVLYLAAEAQRLTGAWKEALDTYGLFLKEFPKHELAEAAAWGRVLAAEEAGDTKLLGDMTAAYLGTHPKGTHAYDAQMLRADAVYRGGGYAAAVPMYDALWALPERKKEPAARQAAILFRRAHARFEVKRHGEAGKLFLQVAGEFPGEEIAPKALWMAAQSALAEQKTAEAYDAYRRLLEGYPRYGERARMMKDAGMLAGALKNPADMIRWMTAYLGEKPEPADAAEAHYWLAVARQETGENAPAAEHWRQARTLDAGRYYQPAAQQLIRLALLAEDLEMLEKEVAEYDRWRETHTYADAVPLNVYEWLGQELAQRGRAGAEAMLRRVLAGSQDAEQRYRAHLRLCRFLTAQNNPGAAVREWKSFRAAFPQHADQAEVMESLGRALLASGEYDEAQRLAEDLLRRYPEGVENARGRILVADLALEKRRYEEAAKLYAAAALLIEDAELTPLALWRAEQAYRKAGQEKEADQMVLRRGRQYPQYRPPLK